MNNGFPSRPQNPESFHMPFTSNPAALTNNTLQRGPAGASRRPSPRACRARKLQRRNARHVGKVCPVIVVMMPFGVPLWLAVRFRKWLRRRLGRDAGNLIGKVAIIVFGRPPLVIPCVIFRLLGLAQKGLNKLEQLRRMQRTVDGESQQTGFLMGASVEGTGACNITSKTEKSEARNKVHAPFASCCIRRSTTAWEPAKP
jgi:hypothetical protein